MLPQALVALERALPEEMVELVGEENIRAQKNGQIVAGRDLVLDEMLHLAHHGLVIVAGHPFRLAHCHIEAHRDHFERRRLGLLAPGPKHRQAELVRRELHRHVLLGEQRALPDLPIPRELVLTIGELPRAEAATKDTGRAAGSKDLELPSRDLHIGIDDGPPDERLRNFGAGSDHVGVVE